MDVALLRWPREADHRESLVRRGEPRLLLLERGERPPPPLDCLEDWVLPPVSDDEVRARMGALLARQRLLAPAVPDLDGDGLLRRGPAWVPLPPMEARLAGALLDRFGAVVSREGL